MCAAPTAYISLPKGVIDLMQKTKKGVAAEGQPKDSVPPVPSARTHILPPALVRVYLDTVQMLVRRCRPRQGGKRGGGAVPPPFLSSPFG